MILIGRGNVSMNVWINVWNPNISHAFVVQNIYLGNICFKCLDISSYQKFVYRRLISGYVWKCLLLQRQSSNECLKVNIL